MINCKRCGNKLGCWFAGEDHVVDECDDYVKITNGDRIRHMTDEDFALWIGLRCGDSKDVTFKEWLAWLKDEVEE